jgi:hypothetical protein
MNNEYVSDFLAFFFLMGCVILFLILVRIIEGKPEEKD